VTDEPIVLFCSLGLAGVLSELRPRFEQAIGRPLDVRFGPTAALSKEIEAGAAFDVTVLTAPAIDAFIKSGHVAAGTRADIARSCVGVTVAPGARKPDISTVAAFKAALLAAKTVCYTAQGASGQHFASLLPRLGIEDAIKRKALIVHGLVAESVLRGEADLGIQQVSEILAVPGAMLVGPIPQEVQAYTVFAAGVGAGAKNPAAAHALIKLLTAADTIALAVSKGMEAI
jgi:molybdate transport system substrate-binding protein